jgi:superfamily II DNA or RNA helicase
MRQYKSNSKAFIIADEVHGLGAQVRRKGLIDEYEFRLGLSATPKRWFDPAGTKVLYEYFGDTIYEFGLEKAINTINPATGRTYLAPYRYKIRFAPLSTEELEEYIIKTSKIVKLWKRKGIDDDQSIYLEQLLFARANIIKNAQAKYEELEKILDILPPPIKWTLIYCSPQQIETVMKLLKDRGIFAHRFTMEEGTTPSKNFKGLSEREYLLEEFSKGNYQVLVAMRCLDEGVDVPPARTAILLSSSGNPREYIQRIGRVLRSTQDKREATIYDIVVFPNLTILSPEIRRMEKKIIEKELKRYEEISKNALNNAEALSIITEAVQYE